MSNLSIRDIARVVLPRSSRDGGLFMLSAYFDDSGTHLGSEIVVVGGLLGTEAQWLPFEKAWKAVLAAPVEGRALLRRFHMTACEAGEDEFVGWSRAERDLVICRFRDVILEHQVARYAMAVARADWDRLIVGQIREMIGDAERYCVSSCILHALDWTQAFTEEREVALIFDDRNKENIATERIFKIYNDVINAQSDSVRPTSITFTNSQKMVPLQGADMIAWETYNHAKEILISGLDAPLRPHFSRLDEAGRLTGQIARPEDIAKIAEETEASLRSEGLL